MCVAFYPVGRLHFFSKFSFESVSSVLGICIVLIGISVITIRHVSCVVLHMPSKHIYSGKPETGHIVPLAVAWLSLYLLAPLFGQAGKALAILGVFLGRDAHTG